MIRCLRTTRLGALDAGLGEDRLLLLAALDEALRLEPLEHLAGGRARHAEHLRDARRDRALARRPVLADREREEVDHLEVLVDRMPVRRPLRRHPTRRRWAWYAGSSGRGLCPRPTKHAALQSGRGQAHVPATSGPEYARRMPLASVYPLVSTRSLARPFTYEVPEGMGKGAVVSVRLGRRSVRGVVADVGVIAPPGRRARRRRRGARRDSRRRSSTSRSGSPTTTARRPPARSSSSRRRVGSPRGERPSPAIRESLAGEPEPA